MTISLSILPLRIPIQDSFVESYRLQALVSFRKKNSYSVWSDAIVDSGALISVIPRSIWEDLEYKIISPSKIVGINANPQCQFSSDLAMIKMAISDKYGNRSPLFYTISHLCKEDSKTEIPLILGFYRCLEFFHFSAKIRKNEASLEWDSN